MFQLPAKASAAELPPLDCAVLVTGGSFLVPNGAAGTFATAPPTDDPAVLARRAADARALLATLLLSRGTPMLSMGDEAGRTQHGNNNAYAQDNPTAWFDWSSADTETCSSARYSTGVSSSSSAECMICERYMLTTSLIASR